MAGLDMEEVGNSVADRLERYKFAVAAQDVFNAAAPPNTTAQIIFEIRKRAVIGRMRVDQGGDRWLRLGCMLCGETDGRTREKTVFTLPQGFVVYQGGQNGAFIARYGAVFPVHELERQIKNAAVLIAGFRNQNICYLREFQFADSIRIEIVPPKCLEAKKLAAMGGLARSFCMAWLYKQLPLKFSTGQRVEIQAIAKKHDWCFKRGEPLFTK